MSDCAPDRSGATVGPDSPTTGGWTASVSFENPPTRPAWAAKLSDPVVEVTLAAIAAVAAIAAIAALLLDLDGDDEAVLIGAVLVLAALQVPSPPRSPGACDGATGRARRCCAARSTPRGSSANESRASSTMASSRSWPRLRSRSRRWLGRADHLPGSEGEALSEIGARVRSSVRGLRGLSTEIYPLENPEPSEDLGAASSPLPDR